jgi:hypothetical protein
VRNSTPETAARAPVEAGLRNVVVNAPDGADCGEKSLPERFKDASDGTE